MKPATIIVFSMMFLSITYANGYVLMNATTSANLTRVIRSTDGSKKATFVKKLLTDTHNSLEDKG